MQERHDPRRVEARGLQHLCCYSNACRPAALSGRFSECPARFWRTILLFTLLLVAGCASPREKAFKTALKDYKRANQATAEFVRAQVKQLVAVTRAFRSAIDRWPQTFDELVGFATQNKLVLDPFAFSDVTFAEMADGTVQIHYDVNCARFNTPLYKFTQTGSVNVKAK